MKKKVLVLVKAEPAPSSRYGACVCTAGITDEGEFIRLYPVPYYTFCDDKKKFRKYDWIEVECQKSKKDNRRESYKIDPDSIKVLGHIDTRNNWCERNKLVLPKLSKNINEIKESGASIGLIKPSKVLDFKYEYLQDSSELTGKDFKETLQTVFDTEKGVTKKIPHIEKMDKHYTYTFECEGENTTHNIMCEDWELYQSSRKWIDTYGTESQVWNKIHDKFFTKFTTENDLYFFMGTHWKYKTWIIIGIYYPPKK